MRDEDQVTAGRGGERSLANLLPRARFIGCDDVRVRSVCDEAERCRRGDVFVARLTPQGDGHDAVSRAIARGAAGVVAERIVPTGGVPLCLVPDTAWALGRVAHALAGDPARELKLIAVTGTSGKTTTAWLVAAVLAEAEIRVGVLSDLGCLGPDATTPERVNLGTASAVADRLHRFASAGCTHAVVEVSSRMLAEQVLAGAICDTLVVVNRAAAPRPAPGRHRSAAVTEGILDLLSATGGLVTGAGATLAPLRRRALARWPGIDLRSAGTGDRHDVSIRSLDRDLGGRTVLVGCGGQFVPATLTTPVAGFAHDAALAVAVGRRYGVPPEVAVRGIESAGGIPGRVERIDHGQDAAVFLDAATSGHALAATLSSLRRLTPGRLVLLADAPRARAIGGAGFAKRAARWCDACVVVSPDVMHEPARAGDLAAYARIDRLLAGLGRRDCLLVLGGRSGLIPGPGPGPDDGEPGLGDIVSGWLQLAHPPLRGRSARWAA